MDGRWESTARESFLSSLPFFLFFCLFLFLSRVTLSSPLCFLVVAVNIVHCSTLCTMENAGETCVVVIPPKRCLVFRNFPPFNGLLFFACLSFPPLDLSLSASASSSLFAFSVSLVIWLSCCSLLACSAYLHHQSPGVGWRLGTCPFPVRFVCPSLALTRLHISLSTSLSMVYGLLFAFANLHAYCFVSHSRLSLSTACWLFSFSNA